MLATKLKHSVCVLVVIFWSVSYQQGACDDLTERSLLYRQLQTPMTSVMDGASYRSALEKIANQLSLNLCLDRRVDPTAKVHVGQVGPTVFAIIKKIADEHQCVVMPAAGVVLVGRQDWVDQTSAALLAIDPDKSKPVDIIWDDLTTPTQAFGLVLGDSSSIDLPHDLWPATRWKEIDRAVAASLILAQFDRRLRNGRTLQGSEVELIAADSSGKFARSYPTGQQAALVRKTIAAADRGSQVRAGQQSLEIQATATAHRMATDAMLTKLAADMKPQPIDDTQTYSLENTKSRAGDAINQFARAAGRKCTIDPAATKACQEIVTLTANNKTLQELIGMVANQANLAIKWTDTEVRVSLPAAPAPAP